MNEQGLEKKATKPVDARRQYRKQLVTFLVGAPLLGVINFFTTDFPWSVFLISGWLGAMGYEAWRVYGRQKGPAGGEGAIEDPARKSSSSDESPNDAV